MKKEAGELLLIARVLSDEGYEEAAMEYEQKAVELEAQANDLEVKVKVSLHESKDKER